MSSFTPPISPLGTGQGVISGISQRQSSRTTPIHILDDDSLLNMFHLYRLDIALTDEDEDIDDGEHISILSGTRWDHEHWWYKPAHVCRRWRNLILLSASFLDLHLVCRLGTPIADKLAHSPSLPLVIQVDDYVNRDRNIEEIFFALEQPNRIRCIRVELSLRDLQKFVMAIDGELPILEHLVMVTGDRSEDDATLVLPETIQAPHLRLLALEGIAPPIESQLLTTATGIVTLYLSMHDTSTNSNTFQWISSLPQLEMLVIVNVDVRTQLSQTPTITHATLPNLRLLSLEGVIAYIEAFICQITTPRLEWLRVLFLDQLTFSIPCLVRFMNTTVNKKLRYDAKFELFIERYLVVPHPHENRLWMCSFSLSAGQLHLNGHDISSMAQIVDALGQEFSAIEHLILGYEEDEDEEDSWLSEDKFEVEVNRSEWDKLLRPFSNVKYLRVKHGLVNEFSHYLQLYNGELPPELLPELRRLTYPGNGFTSFIDARQNAGHPVSLVRHGSPPPPPAPTPTPPTLCQTDAVRRFLESVEKSKEREDEWLSTEDTVKMVCIFQNDATAAEFYTTIADCSTDETTMRMWVQSQLESNGMQRGDNL